MREQFEDFEVIAEEVREGIDVLRPFFVERFHLPVSNIVRENGVGLIEVSRESEAINISAERKGLAQQFCVFF